MTPLVAGAKARAAKISAYAETVSEHWTEPTAPDVPTTARVASLRKALPAPTWSWTSMSEGAVLMVPQLTSLASWG